MNTAQQGGGPPQQQQQQPNNNQITPELLVDALSGHEDGLLAIAENLMLHYDSGYDAMGEAIIDAFADVQKLFQHVVEAAHMEGAAFERERREGEWKDVRVSVERRLGVSLEDVLYGSSDDVEDGLSGGEGDALNHDNSKHSQQQERQQQQHRHEELIDQDVRDVLIEAIKRGNALREKQQYDECRSLFEKACASASALLPVDSDHRGRLQLAIARAESMTADRSCAILRYAMDDLLRSGLTLSQGKYRQVDIRERGDCVLSRPDPLLRSEGSRLGDLSLGSGSRDWNSSYNNNHNNNDYSHDKSGAISNEQPISTSQSPEEALASLVEEMKEILEAPVYATTPLQSVSEKFWGALGEARRSQGRKEERLEQALAKIKADFLLAREEWEEQLSEEREKTNSIKRRFNELKLKSDRDQKEIMMQHQQSADSAGVTTGGNSDANAMNLTPNRGPHSATGSSGANSGGGNNNNTSYHFNGFGDTTLDSSSSQAKFRTSRNGSNSSVVSMGSEFAQRAKGLVHLLNCQGRESHQRQLNIPQAQPNFRGQQSPSPRSSVHREGGNGDGAEFV